mmetsp:Transcript_3598/g.8628  ORF Transcript_3598/g.8628 Transcript_3598/m.8628 type:complete len:261 (-) Transcript_3598:266-1048(-)
MLCHVTSCEVRECRSRPSNSPGPVSLNERPLSSTVRPSPPMRRSRHCSVTCASVQSLHITPEASASQRHGSRHAVCWNSALLATTSIHEKRSFRIVSSSDPWATRTDRGHVRITLPLTHTLACHGVKSAILVTLLTARVACALPPTAFSNCQTKRAEAWRWRTRLVSSWRCGGTRSSREPTCVREGEVPAGRREGGSTAQRSEHSITGSPSDPIQCRLHGSKMWTALPTDRPRFFRMAPGHTSEMRPPAPWLPSVTARHT